MELGLDKYDFLDLTPYEFHILAGYSGRATKSNYEILRNVIYNAGLNLMRGKDEKITPLFEENKSEISVQDLIDERSQFLEEAKNIEL